MREVILKNGEKVYIKSASGYNDGFYWEMLAIVVWNNTEYTIQDAGSGSGWIPDYTSISSKGPCKLVSLKQLCESSASEKDEDWDYIESAIKFAISKFTEFGCKTSCEITEHSIHVDGKKVESTYKDRSRW